MVNGYKVNSYELVIRSEASNSMAYVATMLLKLTALSGSIPPRAYAHVTFYEHEVVASLPSNSMRTDRGTTIYSTHFRPFWFNSIVDLLRNEDPVYFWFDEGTKGAYLNTSGEPTGEGE